MNLRTLRAVALLWLLPALALAGIIPEQVELPPDIGLGMHADASISWSRTQSGSNDSFSLAVPPQLAIDGPLPAGCSSAGASISCQVPDGPVGAGGTVTLGFIGAQIGGFNLTATGNNTPTPTSASVSANVRSSGDLGIVKTKTAPAGDAISGAAVTFVLEPTIAVGGSEVPAGASIVVRDRLPALATDFQLTARTFAGRTPSCNTVASANASRELVCTYDGPFSVAQLNASRITLTGTQRSNGSFVNQAEIASANDNYFDRDLDNNTASVTYQALPGTDLVAQGSFPAGYQATGSSQTLVLTYRNAGPLATTGGVVETIVPPGFVLGSLPAGCSSAPGSLTVSGTDYSGTRVSCVTDAVGSGANQSFSLPLTLPTTPTAGNFPVLVTPPADMTEVNQGNNAILLPYQVAEPFADLSLAKSKSPATGPHPPGTTVTTTFTIGNEADSLADAVYTPAQPLRVVDYLRPEEIDAGGVTTITAGWSCSATPGVDNSPWTNDGRSTQIECHSTGSGTLVRGASMTVAFSTVLDAAATPTEMSNYACTGANALSALGLLASDGPQPADPFGSNDCDSAGAGLVNTPVTAGKAQVSIVKESSVDGLNWFDPASAAPTLAVADEDLHWRITITTPDAATNPGQATIPTLRLTDNLPGILSVTNAPGAPAQNFVTPAIPISITRSGSGANDCPAQIDAGQGSLDCGFSDVEPGETIVVRLDVQRPLMGASATLGNTATLSSPDAILSGTLSDDAAVIVEPRIDVALTSKTVNPANPRVGEVLQFAMTVRNLGPGVVPAGDLTVTDTLFTGTPTLSTPAYEVLSVTAANPARIDCGASNLATGAISCTNAVALDRYETQSITIQARIKKPSGDMGAADDILYAGVTNTAQAVLANQCEFRTETTTLPVSTSTACNDAAATSNNAKTVTFDVSVPAIDLQQAKVPVYPSGQTQFRLGDTLRYRFTVRNAGPSRAERIVMTDLLDPVPAGFGISLVDAGTAAAKSVNTGSPDANFSFVARNISCSQPGGANTDLVCQLDSNLDDSWLDAGQMVRFELELAMSGTATGPVVFGNRAYVCADETVAYESSGRCTDDVSQAGNNIAAVNNTIFPSADLELVSKATVTPSPVDVGQPVRYDIVLANNGPATVTKLRLVDTLPGGFEWLASGAQLPTASAAGASTLNATLSVAGSVPPAGTDNVCYVSNGIGSITAPSQRQAITCDLGGSFPAGAVNTVTVTLWAHAKPGVYDGSAQAPFLSDRSNEAVVRPGRDGSGEETSIDANPDNNDGASVVQVANARLSGRVFFDRNDNGDQDGTGAGEDHGIAGVTLRLTGTDIFGNAIDMSVTTDAAGDYVFNGLPPSDAAGYSVTQTQPTGYDNGTPQPNTPRAVRNDTSSNTSAAGGGYTTGNTATTSVIGGIVLDSGADARQFDFPEYTGRTLSGFVYADLDHDQLRNPASDAPIANAVVELLEWDGSSYVKIDETTTQADGSYQFAGLLPSRRYALREPLPAGYLNQPLAINPGSIDGTACGPACTTQSGAPGDDANADRINDIVLAAGDGTDFNFGEIAQATISGRVYVDRDDDGDFNNADTGIGGVTIVIRDPGPDGLFDTADDITVDITTQADGSYTYADAVAGRDYRIEEQQPDGFVDGKENGTASPTPNQILVTNLPAAGSSDNDFGELGGGSISGRVYGDANDNGVPDTGEQGLEGVTIELDGTDDLGNPVHRSTSTDADGNYRFDDLRPGNYTVSEPDQPPGTQNGTTTPGTIAGTSTGTASDRDTTPSTISDIVLPLGGASIGNNFGEIGDSPDLRVSKSASSARFTVNNRASYTIQVRNAGQRDTSGEYLVRDRLPQGITLAEGPGGDGWSCTGAAGDQRFECRSSEVLAAGSTSTSVIRLSVMVSAQAANAGVVDNAVLVEGGGESELRAPTSDERDAFEGDVTQLPVCDAAITHNACRVPTEVQLAASVGGTVWFDVGSDADFLDGGDERLPDWIVELVDPASGEVVATTPTAADGSYRFDDLVPGVRWNIRFREPSSGVVWAWPVNRETPAGTGVACAPDAAIANGEASACRIDDDGSSQLQVVLKPGEHLPQQSLPVAPSVVYDAVTRDPVPGAVVTLTPAVSCSGYDPATAILNAGAGGYRIEGDAISMTVGTSGYYQFVFGPAAPARCDFRLTVTPPGDYRFVSSLIPPQDGALAPQGVAGGVHRVQPQADSPSGAVGQATQYWLDLSLGSSVANVAHNHIPLDTGASTALVIVKTGDRRIAEIGDVVLYTVTIRQVAGGTLRRLDVLDTLPRGFTYINGTARVDGRALPDPQGRPGPRLRFTLGAISPGGQLTLNYRVRVGVGAQQGDGVNRAQAHGCSIDGGCIEVDGYTPVPGSLSSNRSQYRVRVTGGVFASEACVLGKIFVDCNDNHVQDPEELGIPGVRLYFSDGTWMVSDSEGKYSYCGLPPQSHTLKVDPSTLPVGSRLTTSSNRNLGDADSLFLDLKNGELHRADFIEGSCSNRVLEQVKARRTQGEVRAPESETGQGALRFESKPLRAPQQATDSARQGPIVRQRASAEETAAPDRAATAEVQP